MDDLHNDLLGIIGEDVKDNYDKIPSDYGFKDEILLTYRFSY